MMKLLPAPKQVTEKPGQFPLAPCDVVVIGQLDIRVIRAAVRLKDALAKKTGSFHRFCRKQEPVKQAICIQEGAGLPKEGYTLEIDEDGIRLVGGDAAGCFYGIQTLMQLVEGAQGSLACVSIQDAPDMAHRGFYHDATRGRVPTVDGVKRIVDMLARLKVNSFQIYVEHSFDFFEFCGQFVRK